MFRCTNIIPTEPGMPPVQCEDATDVPDGFCPTCTFLVSHMAREGAEIVGHFDASCIHTERKIFVARRVRPQMHTEN